MEYPKRRIIKWFDSETKEIIGEAEYLLATPKLERVEDLIRLVNSMISIAEMSLDSQVWKWQEKAGLLLSEINAEIPVLKSGLEWAKDCSHTILDPDGWRLGDGVTLETPISIEEYRRRHALSTVLQKQIP